MSRKTIAQSFDEHWKENPSTGCWEWQRGKDARGYGRLMDCGKQSRAHCVSYKRANGEIPIGLHVLHSCDNPSCVNPRHLFVGTHLENQRDKVAKGRQQRGESHTISKLNETDIERIRDISRAAVAPQKTIANYFGICQMQVSRIVRREQWGHVFTP